MFLFLFKEPGDRGSRWVERILSRGHLIANFCFFTDFPDFFWEISNLKNYYLLEALKFNFVSKCSTHGHYMLTTRCILKPPKSTASFTSSNSSSASILFHIFSSFLYLSRTFFLERPRTFSNFHLNPWGLGGSLTFTLTPGAQRTRKTFLGASSPRSVFLVS